MTETYCPRLMPGARRALKCGRKPFFVRPHEPGWRQSRWRTSAAQPYALPASPTWSSLCGFAKSGVAGARVMPHTQHKMTLECDDKASLPTTTILNGFSGDCPAEPLPTAQG